MVSGFSLFVIVDDDDFKTFVNLKRKIVKFCFLALKTARSKLFCLLLWHQAISRIQIPAVKQKTGQNRKESGISEQSKIQIQVPIRASNLYKGTVVELPALVLRKSRDDLAGSWRQQTCT